MLCKAESWRSRIVHYLLQGRAALRSCRCSYKPVIYVYSRVLCARHWDRDTECSSAQAEWKSIIIACAPPDGEINSALLAMKPFLAWLAQIDGASVNSHLFLGAAWHNTHHLHSRNLFEAVISRPYVCIWPVFLVIAVSGWHLLLYRKRPVDTTLGLKFLHFYTALRPPNVNGGKRKKTFFGRVLVRSSLQLYLYIHALQCRKVISTITSTPLVTQFYSCSSAFVGIVSLWKPTVHTCWDIKMSKRILHSRPCSLS